MNKQINTPGLSTYYYAGSKLSERIGVIAEAGFKKIEIWANTPDRHFDYHKQEQIKELEVSLKTYGVEVETMHSPFFGNNDFSALDETQHRATMSEFEYAINVLSGFGGKVMVVHPSNWTSKDASELYDPEKKAARVKQIIKSVDILYNVCDKCNVTLAFETLLPDNLAGNIHNYQEIISAVKNKYVKVCVDTSHLWLWQGKSVEEWVDGFKGLIVTTHLSDNSGTGRDRHLTLNAGDIKWENVFNALQRGVFENAYMLEVQHPPASDNVSAEVRLKELYNTVTGYLSKL
ncbi:MAG: sugar phosphate isomerase/epimerase family protein [Elusimicrobiota bacterium]